MTSEADKLIGTITLRDVNKVYRHGDDYRVVQENKDGEGHARIILGRAVEFLGARMATSEASMEKAMHILENAAKELSLPYYFAQQSRAYTRDVLLVLTALGRVRYKRNARKYVPGGKKL